MPSKNAYIARALSLALITGFLCGCNWLGLSERSQSQAGDLVLDLGNRTRMYFVWVDPLQLFVGQYEVSNKIFRRFHLEHNSGTYKQLDLNADDLPVVNVSWNTAQQFCDWLNEKYGLGGGRQLYFRLPTEKEWETCASSGEHTEYPWGADWPPPSNWNYYGRENPEPAQKLDRDDGFRVACPVLRSGRNAWRLFGLGGNVWEWCADDVEALRVYKGASWADCNPYFLQLARQSRNMPSYRHSNLGFRVVAERRAQAPTAEAPAAAP